MATKPAVPAATVDRASHANAVGPDVAAWILGFIGLYLVGLSLLGLISPGTFFNEIGPFGERNDHYIRDAMTFQIALGILALLAVRQRALRLTAIGLVGLNFCLHGLNHLLDIGEADPEWVGTADFIGLALGTVALVWLFFRVRREERR
jgi:hypothetical protein